MTKNKQWSDIAFVSNSKYRKQILLDLETKPNKPSSIARKNKWVDSIVSRALTELEQKGLVELLTPDMKHGRFYALTEKGKEVLKNLKEFKE